MSDAIQHVLPGHCIFGSRALGVGHPLHLSGRREVIALPCQDQPQRIVGPLVVGPQRQGAAQGLNRHRILAGRFELLPEIAKGDGVVRHQLHRALEFAQSASVVPLPPQRNTEGVMSWPKAGAQGDRLLEFTGSCSQVALLAEGNAQVVARLRIDGASEQMLAKGINGLGR